MILLTNAKGLLVVFSLFIMAGCALPPLDGRSTTYALTQSQTSDSKLGQAAGNLAASEKHDNSGVLPLPDPLDAFVARAVLAQLSERSLDIQYYIWQNDVAGQLLIKALYEAAERGVNVRLLLDDNGISGMDPILTALDQHPNIEVRIFNPFPTRSFKTLGFITDFNRLNHRMHNKSFTADSQATIIGGRNISNAYFGRGTGALFADLDVLTMGPAASQVSQDFDRYWNSQSSYPAHMLLADANDSDLKNLAKTLSIVAKSEEARRFVDALEQSDLSQQILSRDVTFYQAPIRLVSDNPSKVLGTSSEEELLSKQLATALGEPKTSVVLVSPYFVPGDAGVELFRKLEEAGVEVTILTNSLEANDVAMVHSGYARYRKPLLKAGVELFEMRKFIDQGLTEKVDHSGLLGSSSASLHAKTFAVDGETLFVGSFNFDPRSNNINTEMGFLIENQALASSLHQAFPDQVLQIAYKVRLNEHGNLTWLEQNDEEVIQHSHDPNVGIFKRSMVYLLSLLPLEGLL